MPVYNQGGDVTGLLLICRISYNPFWKDMVICISYAKSLLGIFLRTYAKQQFDSFSQSSIDNIHAKTHQGSKTK